MDNGVQSPNLPRATTVDSLIGNSGGTTARQLVTDLAAQLVASEPMRLGTMMGQLYDAYDDLPATTAQVTPWVINDPDPEKIGIYKVSGGEWVWALPLPYSIITATIGDGDTVNVRQLITALPVVDGTAIIIPVVGTNTASPVVVHINGGDAITLKSNSGSDIDEGGLPGSGRLMAIREGSILRLNNDVVATAVLAAAEAARDAAQGFAEAAAEADALSGATAARDAAVAAKEIASAAAVTALSAEDNAEAAAAVSIAASTAAVTAAANAQSSARTSAAWATLATLTPSAVGQGAEVLDSDVGTHTDPSTALTVANAGRYTAYATTVGAWTRIGGTGLSGKVGIDVVGTGGSLINTGQRGYAYGVAILQAWTDASKRFAAGITAAGVLLAKFGIRAAAGSGLTFTRATDGWWEIGFGALADLVGFGSGGAAIDTSKKRYFGGKEVRSVDADQAGRIGIAVGADGAVRIPHLNRLDACLDTATSLYTTDWASGFLQIFRTVKSTGVKTQLTTRGNNEHPRLSADGTKLLFSSDRDGGRDIYWQDIAGGPSYPAKTRRGIVCYGDSLTYGQGATTLATDAYPAQLATALGRVVTNVGVAGNTSSQISIRAGAVQPALTVSGDSIVSGANTVTAATYAGASFLTGLPAMVGTLAGVRGTWNGSTFTPFAGQTLPVSCPAGTAFYPDPFDNDLQTAVIWSGRNNYTDPTRVKADIAAMVAFLKPLVKQIVIHPVINGNYAAEFAGQSAYITMMQLNADLKALYPAWYGIHPTTGLDLRETLVAAYNSSITQDVTDHGNDIVPSSLRVDNIHLTTAGYTIVANFTKDIILARGY